MVFVMRKLDQSPQALGTKLKELRCGQTMSLDMVAEKTRIQRKYLVALERGDYASLPDPIYTRNYIRMYARLLDADEKYFLELYEEECGQCDLVAPLQTPRQRIQRIQLFVWNRLVKFLALFVIVGLIIFYISSQVHALISPPELIIFSPLNESVTSDAFITIDGYVGKESNVYIGDKQAIVRPDNTFSTSVSLEGGLNLITVRAARRYSRTAEIQRTVRFEPEDLSTD